MLYSEIIKDRWEWENWLRRVNSDVYDHYDYLLANCEEGDQPELFVAVRDTGILVYPYIRRNISHQCDDLVTAYGYGGPFREGDFSTQDIEEARKIFLSRPENAYTVTETIRYHPCRIDEKLMTIFGKTVPIRKTVHVLLDDGFEQLQQKFSKMTKRNVNRAQRDNVSVVLARQHELETFIKVYKATMNRLQANATYYFPDRYFEDLWKSESCETEILFAVYEGSVVAGVFLLFGDDGAHYHLGGSYGDYLSLRPNHLLFSEMIRRSVEKHKRYLHLGGGATGDDALFAFKQSFTSDPPLTYYIGQAVLNEDVYNRLNIDHLDRYGPSTYFPLYRTPVEQPGVAAQTKRST